MEDLQGHVGSERDEDIHREIVELLPWYLNETLTPKERAQVGNHLRDCAACRLELEELQGLQKIATAEALEFSESLLERTLRQIRTSQQPVERIRSGWLAEWAALRRPRLAFSISMLVLVFLGLGVFLGLQIGANGPAIGGAPIAVERPQQTTEKYFAFPREILLQGTFTTQIGDRPLAHESFTLEKQVNGELLLTSKIESNELSRAGDAVQRLRLTAELKPISYVLQGPLVYGGDLAEATITDGQAVLSLSGQEISQREVALDQFPVMLDFSMMSHFALIQYILSERLAQGAALTDLRFTTLTPQALRAEPLLIKDAKPTVIESQGQLIQVTRYTLAVGQGENLLSAELYVRDSDGVLVGVYIPAQSRMPSSGAITAFRSDLYPQGLNLGKDN
jgi:hypothetical protein